MLPASLYIKELPVFVGNKPATVMLNGVELTTDQWTYDQNTRTLSSSLFMIGEHLLITF